MQQTEFTVDDAVLSKTSGLDTMQVGPNRKESHESNRKFTDISPTKSKRHSMEMPGASKHSRYQDVPVQHGIYRVLSTTTYYLPLRTYYLLRFTY